ncbi:hypothetical protein AB0N20_27335 [Streptomyces griseoincarnatus]
MTATPEPTLAPDGVQEVRLTDARALLSRLIEDAREKGRVTALTVRGRRRICLVTPEFYEEAVKALGKRP